MPKPLAAAPISIQSAPRHSSNFAPPAKLVSHPEIYFHPKPSSRSKHPLRASTLLTATLLAASFAIPQLARAQMADRPAAFAQLTPLLNDPANLTGERVSPADLADTLPIDHGAPALQQLLLKLRTRASFMLIVAHPDDEDGGLLTFLSRGQGARVAMLTLNRGEGGQNRMTADFDDALGLIRTQELLAADRYMGVDQFFGTEVDFGFSKTKEESFAKWTHERVLYDAVRAVRLYRPLVIASVFIGGPTDGHGQHQVAGQIAQEVFNAAGDPNVFPDQIAAGLQPWQPLKVYARVPYARIVTDATGAQTMYDSATNQYVPARFTSYVTGKVTTTIPPANVIIPEGDPATYTSPDGTKTPIPGMEGLSYVQFAREGLALQKTQIGPNARLASPGPHDVSYHRYGSHIPSPNGKPQPDGDADPTLEPSLFTGIDTTLPGIADLAPEASDKLRPALEKIDAQIAEAQRLFSPTHPELTAPPLRTALGTVDGFLHELNNPDINDLPSNESYNLRHELRIKRTQLNNALVLALSLELKAVLGKDVDKDHQPQTPAELLTSDKFVSITEKESNNSPYVIGVGNGTLDPIDATMVNLDGAAILHPAESRTSTYDSEINPPLPANRPYFSRKNIEQPFYDISDPNLRNAPATPPSLTLRLALDFQGAPLSLVAIVEDGRDDHAPVVAIPPISLTVDPQVGIMTPTFLNAGLNMTVNSADRQTSGKLSVEGPPGWDSSDSNWFDMANANEEHHDTLFANPPQYSFKPLAALPTEIPPGSVFTVNAVADVSGHQYREGYRSVGYPGLAYTNYYTPATYRVTAVDVHAAPNLNIAYLPGTGDDIPYALEDLGVQAHILTTADLTPQSLKPYDAVILGVRAYEAHPELAAANAALNTYAANGGIVIAQYNTSRLPENTGPYPLSLGPAEKVVEEDAPVQILTPTDPLLTWPNPITSADFDHWIEERGHGFMGTWDPHYTPLLETHDHGQQPQRGGLLIARTGRGAWIYLGLALYRQLPEGVPGAYRILANLISAAKNPALQKQQP
jgi:LmbE family N-acetylglucosaminyl deacetylase